MTNFAFQPPPHPAIPIVSAMGGQAKQFPIHRIFCVGRNYAAHAAEMGGEVDREAPWYFCKSPSSYCPSGATIPYAPGTENLHHEVELFAAIGAHAFRTSVEAATSTIFGYGVGLDLTRRDRQQDGKDNRRPWDLGKDFENSAVLAPITPASEAAPVGEQTISLRLNGDIRQSAQLSDMVWSLPEIIAHLSQFYHLQPGDVIMTGTPAGVGPMQVGDQLRGEIEGLVPVDLTIGPPA